MLTELPDWITARWNKRVIESQEETKTFPGLSQFVDYVAKEAKIACNPVTFSSRSEVCWWRNSEDIKDSKMLVRRYWQVDLKKRQMLRGGSFVKSQIIAFTHAKSSRRSQSQNMTSTHRQKNWCFGCLKPGRHSRNCGKREECLEHTWREPFNKLERKADEQKERSKGQRNVWRPVKL